MMFLLAVVHWRLIGDEHDKSAWAVAKGVVFYHARKSYAIRLYFQWASRYCGWTSHPAPACNYLVTMKHCENLWDQTRVFPYLSIRSAR